MHVATVVLARLVRRERMASWLSFSERGLNAQLGWFVAWYDDQTFNCAISGHDQRHREDHGAKAERPEAPFPIVGQLRAQARYDDPAGEDRE